MKILAFCMILALATAPTATLAQQQMTTEQVLAKLDEKAKVFNSLEASLAKQQVVYGVKQPLQSGKIYIKMVNSVPRISVDITSPKQEAMTALIKDGTATVYFRAQNGYRQGKVDPKSDVQQLLLIGFGVSSTTLSKVYKPEAKGLEAIEGVQAQVLELNSISSATGGYAKITLWLDPETWTPVQTRVTERSKDYTDFKYSKIKLNKGVSDSVFNLRIPAGAKKQ
jgi:outer membrane lipoprotein-sorting protein